MSLLVGYCAQRCERMNTDKPVGSPYTALSRPVFGALESVVSYVGHFALVYTKNRLGSVAIGDRSTAHALLSFEQMISRTVTGGRPVRAKLMSSTP